MQHVPRPPGRWKQRKKLRDQESEGEEEEKGDRSYCNSYWLLLLLLPRVGRTSFCARRRSSWQRRGRRRRRRRPRRRVTEIKSAAFKCSTQNSNSASNLSRNFGSDCSSLERANLLSVAGLTRKKPTTTMTLTIRRLRILQLGPSLLSSVPRPKLSLGKFFNGFSFEAKTFFAFCLSFSHFFACALIEKSEPIYYRLRVDAW